jgi:hypothetical protein
VGGEATFLSNKFREDRFLIAPAGNRIAWIRSSWVTCRVSDDPKPRPRYGGLGRGSVTRTGADSRDFQLVGEFQLVKRATGLAIQKSLSVVAIALQALARTRVIQPPLGHLIFEPVKAEHRGIDGVTSAR